jgi:hypothetical protein
MAYFRNVLIPPQGPGLSVINDPSTERHFLHGCVEKCRQFHFGDLPLGSAHVSVR